MTIAATLPAAAEAAPFIARFDATSVINIALLALLLATGLAIIGQRRLFVVVMLGGVYSLLSAAFFTTLDAVDVAFTEAAVGAGVSTVLLLGAMLLTSREAKRAPRGRRWAPLLVVTATGAALLYASADMPSFGDPESPANAYIGRDYLVRTPQEVGTPNVVTAVLASYRGFDTLGETVVIFTAGLGVMLLLGLRNPRERAREELKRRRRRAARQRASGGEGAE